MAVKLSPLNIVEATPEQIRTFAEMIGIDIDPTDSDNAIFDKVIAGNGGSDMIMLQIDDDPAADMTGTPPPQVLGAKEVPQAAMSGSLGHEDPQVEIQIFNEERNGKTYSADVEVGVNGRAWQLQRNKPIKIPYRVYLALKAAVGQSVTHENTGAEVTEVITDVQRINFNVLKFPSDEAIAEWHERIDNVLLP